MRIVVQYDSEGFEIPEGWAHRTYTTLDDILELAQGMSLHDFNIYINLTGLQKTYFKNKCLKEHLEKLSERIRKGEVIETWTPNW